MTLNFSKDAIKVLGQLVRSELKNHNKARHYAEKYNLDLSDFFLKREETLIDLDSLFNEQLK